MKVDGPAPGRRPADALRILRRSQHRRAAGTNCRCRHQHDQGVLAHVGALAAHVRTGDHQHAACAVRGIVAKHQVVGLERFAADGLDHRMAAAFDADAGLVAQLRLRPVQRVCAFAERGQHVQFGECGGAVAQRLQAGIEFVEMVFVQLRSRASARSRADSTLSSNCLSSSVM